MRISHVQGVFSPEHGGPVYSLSSYCRGQARQGHQVSLWVLEGYPHTSPAVRLEAPVEMHVFKASLPFRFGRSSAMRRALAAAQSSDIYHLHGAWMRAPYYGAVEARKRRRPYLIEMMGTYEAYSLRVKALRKWLARVWYQDRVLKGAACLHVNSEVEAEQIRRLGFDQPIVIIPVGVDMDAIGQHLPVLDKIERWPELGGRRFILFLARIHPKKGIELLLDAWKEVVKDFPEWVLVVAGTGSPDYVSKCQKFAVEGGLEKNCIWAGQVNELEKSWLYARSAYYVLPSYSENFGSTVVESLGHGTPVITTRHTPWALLPEINCGWIADATLPSLESTLRSALAADEVARRRMGQNGRLFVEKSYSQRSVSQKLEDTYQWLLGGPQPDVVRLK
jgi:glycosyltransferase involved in cell wall biosynthesis